MKPTKEQFLAAILKIERFSPAPRVLSKAMGLLRNPNSDIDDIVALIRTDAALTADIIRGSNSAFYGAGERVSSLERALQKIGFRESIRLLNHAVAHLAAGRDLGSYGIAAEDFWAESLFHGLLMEELAKRTGEASPEDAHTAGLLRYIGRLAINQSIDDIGGGLFWNDNVPVEQWELENVGVTQAQAGAILLRNWQFPDATVQAVEWQHRSAEAAQPSWLAGALDFTAALLPPGSESAHLGYAMAAAEELVAVHPFIAANKLDAAQVHSMIELARNGVSTVSRSLHG